MVPPIRQTASIFKQPVTVHNNHKSKVNQELEHGTIVEKPRQLFWEKRLEVRSKQYIHNHRFCGFLVEIFETVTENSNNFTERKIKNRFSNHSN